MAEPFLGEIRIFGGNFAPAGWALCNGQLLSIASNTALFSLLGTTYGGNGTTDFQLPDLRSRVPTHQGTGAGLQTTVIGETLGGNNTSSASGTAPTNFSVERGLAVTVTGTVNAQSYVSNDNRLGMSFIIALEGIFPSRN